MNRKWARKVAEKCIEAIKQEDKEGLWKVLNPVLDAKVPFPFLDEIGMQLGQAGKLDKSRYFVLFDEIVATQKMGGFVIVGQALSQFFETELQEAIGKAAEVVIWGQIWYVCDIVGERVFGQALVEHFEDTISILEQMTVDEEPTVRRSIGVAVHFFAKREPKDAQRMRRLLSVLSLLVEDKRVFVVKGVGWGLKTIGKFQPKLVEDYLQEILKTKRISKLMLRKATKYLDEKTRTKFLELWQQGIQRNRLCK